MAALKGFKFIRAYVRDKVQRTASHVAVVFQVACPLLSVPNASAASACPFAI